MKRYADAEYFPKDYADSRFRFLSRVEKIIGPKDIGHWPISSQRDKNLFVDHVWLPPTKSPEKLFVFTSGIHGEETYAGAAIQSMFLDEILPKIDRQHAGIFIVHAMNPYGFKNHVRYTENHVNLNRNFSPSGTLFKMRNETSAQLCERFLERRPVQSLRSSLLERMTERNGKFFFEEISLDEFIKGTSPGQFEYPENLEFGGHRLEPQTELLIERLRQLMSQFPDVIGFDLHTGLGDRNRLHLLTDGGRTLNQGLFEELFKPDEDKMIYAFTPAHEEGFYVVHGALNNAFGELAGPSQRVCSITMEFGTLGHSLESQVDGLNSFVLNLQGNFYGYATPELERQARSINFARTRPSEIEWELAVIAASRGLFQNVFARAGFTNS